MAQEAKPRICKECKRLLPIDAFERNRPNVWRSECKECRASKKPIPTKVRREYETKHPRPKIGYALIKHLFKDARHTLANPCFVLRVCVDVEGAVLDGVIDMLRHLRWRQSCLHLNADIP